MCGPEVSEAAALQRHQPPGSSCEFGGEPEGLGSARLEMTDARRAPTVGTRLAMRSLDMNAHTNVDLLFAQELTVLRAPTALL
jgi:hypothetical protein